MGWEGQGKDKACTWAWAASGLHAQHTARGGEGRGGEGRGEGRGGEARCCKGARLGARRRGEGSCVRRGRRRWATHQPTHPPTRRGQRPARAPRGGLRRPPRMYTSGPAALRLQAAADVAAGRHAGRQVDMPGPHPGPIGRAGTHPGPIGRAGTHPGPTGRAGTHPHAGQEWPIRFKPHVGLLTTDQSGPGPLGWHFGCAGTPTGPASQAALEQAGGHGHTSASPPLCNPPWTTCRPGG
jgi:hypothetical protein